MKTSTLAQSIASHARMTPDAPALVSGSQVWSYAELAEQTARSAGALYRLEFPRDPIVAIAGNSTELALAALACNAAGLAFLPLDRASIDARWPQLAATAGKRLQRFERLPAADGNPCTPTSVAGDSTALVIATSGSEGAPKLVALSHNSLAAAVRSSAARQPLAADDVWLDCLPLTHIGGQSILWRCLSAGATVRLHDGFDAAAVWQEIAAGRVTHVSLVPAMLAALLDVADTPPPPALRCALLGGAALSPALWQRATAAGWPLYVSYGMSETCAQIAALPPGEDWHEGLAGRPLPGVELRIDDEGRICIRSPQLMRGYLDPQGYVGIGLTDGWFVSGDLGRIDDAGRLVVLGRGDDMLISGGVNLHPQEIEALIAGCPGVTDVAVTATPDPVWGDFLAALLVGPAEPQTVYEWCQKNLSSEHRPRRFLRVDSIPRNAMGKLNRKALRALLTGSSK